jgi:protein-S-isoprenylcysteine O-methyltransferase Ste14
MQHMTLWQMELIPWYVFGAYWAVSWLRVNPVKARETSLDRLLTVGVVVVAFNLLFANWMPIGPLRLRFVAGEPWIGWTGIALTWVGVAIAVWARYCLGVYWSARVTLKEGHQLIRSGPYAFVRHPIYTGMLLGAIGATFVTGEWRGIVAVILLLAAHSRKAMREEALLTKEFGDEYTSYRQHTGFLFPRLGGRGGMDTRTAGS